MFRGSFIALLEQLYRAIMTMCDVSWQSFICTYVLIVCILDASALNILLQPMVVPIFRLKLCLNMSNLWSWNQKVPKYLGIILNNAGVVLIAILFKISSLKWSVIENMG